MAIFERKSPGKVILDDTEVLKVVFESTQNVQGHTEYVIRVQRGPIIDRSWHVCKRYNDFAALHNSVVRMSGISIPLPPKKILGNMDRDFIIERQTALQSYLTAILMNPILASSLGVRRFLDPESYVLNLQEKASHHVSMALRGEENYEFVKSMTEIGWRLRKHYFSVKARLNPRADMVLSWVEYGPDKVMQDKEILAFLKLLVQPVHSNLHKLEFAHCSDVGCYVIRQFNNEGSLRDCVYMSKPRFPFLKKYGSPKQCCRIAIDDIAVYGRQILDVLEFLHEKGIPYGHLHLGNILLVDGKVKLLDIENGILGLPSYYRPFFVQHRKINTLEAVDVYCLGHVLYEMAMGAPLMESVCDNALLSCPSPLREVLESILTSSSCRKGMPTIAELKNHPLFSSHRHDVHTSTLKIPSALRVALKSAHSSIEQRLRHDQKIVRQQKKLAKAQELIVNEYDVKKLKPRLEKDEKKYINGFAHAEKSPPRSESPTSTSTATSAGTVTPPLPATQKLSSVTELSTGRTALLDSICSFNKASLRPKSDHSSIKS